MTDTPAPANQATPEGQPAPAPAPSPASEPQPRYVPAERFDAVTAQKWDAVRRAESSEARTRELEARVAQYEAQRTQAPQAQSQHQDSAGNVDSQAGRTFPAQAGITPTELDRLATIRAGQMRFNEDCNASVAQGRKAFQDFDAKVDELRKVAPTVDAQGRPMLPESLVRAALATGRAHEVLYAMGSDQAEADRIMSISDPTSQAVAVANFARGLKAPGEGDTLEGETASARAREVPPPIKPVVGGSRKISVKDMDLADPALPIEEFMRRRDEEAQRNRRVNGRFR